MVTGRQGARGGAVGPLAGEVAIVTGASSGIGAATARELARLGATVVLAARRAEELEALAEDLRSAGSQVLVIPTDVAEPQQIEHLYARTLDAFGRVDIVVNNAGIGWGGTLDRATPETVAHVVHVNLLAGMLLARAALPGMLARRHGAIISVASVAGHVAVEPLYSATKFGLRGFSLALRRQVAGSGVSVSLVSPGFIRTPMTRSMKLRMPGPEVVARRIARLAYRPRREVVVPGYYRAVAWLERAAPWLLDRALRPRRR